MDLGLRHSIIGGCELKQYSVYLEFRILFKKLLYEAEACQ